MNAKNMTAKKTIFSNKFVNSVDKEILAQLVYMKDKMM